MSSRFNDIARLIESKASTRPDFPVLTFVSTGADGNLIGDTRDYNALWNNGQRLALWLQRQGVSAGDAIIVMMRNYPELVEAMVASALIGAIMVPVDVRSMGDKLAYMLNHVAAKAIIVEGSAVAALNAVAYQLEHVPPLLLVDAADSIAPIQFVAAHYDSALPEEFSSLQTTTPDPQSPMYLMFTSGTTGNPKAVVRTHGAYMRGMKGLRALGVELDDVLYTGLPLCHTNAHSTLSAGLSMEIRTVFSRQFTKSRLWDVCRKFNCTVFTLLGGMIPEVFAVPERDDDANNPVRLIISSGMPARLWEQYERRFGVVITEVYGSTENGGTLINRMGEGPPGSMGKPPPGLIAAILDDDDNPCLPNQPGNLCFRRDIGEPEAVTYFRNVKASSEKVAGGWFRSGDMATMDEDGWFYFLHRVGGGVRRNGDFINTAMVENVLAQSPAVADSYVYGVQTPHKVAGEKALVAAVVLADGGSEEDVRKWAAARLQRNEIPEIWQVLDSIPKTASEKPIERECIELLRKSGLIDAIGGGIPI